VLPHTLALGLPDPFRAARGAQYALVLLEESNLAKVSDPAAGSGGIETLTQQLCEAAWSLFQEIEKAGGVFASLEQNLIQRKVAAGRGRCARPTSPGAGGVTGASEFQTCTSSGRGAGSEAGGPCALWRGKFKFDALPPMRLAAPFESLRDRSDQFEGQGADRKDLSRQSWHTCRFHRAATFAKSFFETGGSRLSNSCRPPARIVFFTSPLGERSTHQSRIYPTLATMG